MSLTFPVSSGTFITVDPDRLSYNPLHKKGIAFSIIGNELALRADFSSDVSVVKRLHSAIPLGMRLSRYIYFSSEQMSLLGLELLTTAVYHQIAGGKNKTLPLKLEKLLGHEEVAWNIELIFHHSSCYNAEFF